MKRITITLTKHALLLLIILFVVTQAQAASYPWKAKWINTEQCQSATNTWLCYRKTVTFDDLPTNLTARIAADTKYWLWINNRLVVFEGGLKRGPTPRDTYYDEVEIAPYLQKGSNTIAILLWHFGKNGFSHINSGCAALLFDCQGKDIQILSDDTWECTPYYAYQNTEAPHPNYRLPESNIRFDARQEIKNWNTTTYKGHFPSALPVANPGEPPFNRLIKRPIPLFKDYGLKSYVTVTQLPGNDTIYAQLPYNCQLTPYLKVEAPAGKTIHLLTDNYRGGGPNNIRAEYITREGIQEYESLGWMNGNQMIYIIPKGVKVLDLKYRETGYDTEFAGHFECNDTFYTQLWKRSARTLYITMRDTYMDCPDRERAQWWGDEVNELGETFYALSPTAHQLALKGIYELINWQRKDGVLFAPVPSGNWYKELPLQMLASVGHYGFYTQYYYSGDSTFIPHIYERLNYYLSRVWKTDARSLVTERPGDWNWGDWGEHVDLGVLTNCWYYLALQAQKEFARILDKTSDVQIIEKRMRRIKENFDARFWTGTAYRSPGYKGATDDRAQAMAVLSGLAREEKYPALKKIFRKEYHASPYMEKYVLEALFRMNDASFALQRMKERYAKMLSYPQYTTLFEGWGVGVDGFGGGTINHAWSGGPLTILSQYLCGIEPTSPGFKTFRIRPQMGTLKSATVTVPSRYGSIKAQITQQKKKITISTIIPSGTQAEIILPPGYHILAVQNYNGKVQGNEITLPEGEYIIQGKK